MMVEQKMVFCNFYIVLYILSYNYSTTNKEKARDQNPALVFKQNFYTFCAKQFRSSSLIPKSSFKKSACASPTLK